MSKLPSDKQIRTLQVAASERGDDMQWLVCERALESAFDTDDYTGGGHRVTHAQWGRLRNMTQEEAHVLCAAALEQGGKYHDQ